MLHRKFTKSVTLIGTIISTGQDTNLESSISFVKYKCRSIISNQALMAQLLDRLVIKEELYLLFAQVQKNLTL